MAHAHAVGYRGVSDNQPAIRAEEAFVLDYPTKDYCGDIIIESGNGLLLAHQHTGQPQHGEVVAARAEMSMLSTECVHIRFGY